MKFRFSEAHVVEHRRLGYTVFREVVPPALIADLRRQAERAVNARRGDNPKLRVLNLSHTEPDLDWKPFRDFAELPELNDAIARVLSPRHNVGKQHHEMRLFFEPMQPFCTIWHRDWRDNSGSANWDRKFGRDWKAKFADPRYFSQFNCALYDDSSTWIVPGTHLRFQDLPAETSWVREWKHRINLDGQTPEEAERVCLDYTQGMPGAQCLLLHPGDFALYRGVAWHIGNYIHYRRRATLHELVSTPEYLAWATQVNAWLIEEQEAQAKQRQQSPTGQGAD